MSWIMIYWIKWFQASGNESSCWSKPEDEAFLLICPRIAVSRRGKMPWQTRILCHLGKRRTLHWLDWSTRLEIDGGESVRSSGNSSRLKGVSKSRMAQNGCLTRGGTDS
jgi:hypothetical protein